MAEFIKIDPTQSNRLLVAVYPRRCLAQPNGLLRLRSHRFNLFGRKALPIFIEARADYYIRSTIAYLAVVLDHLEIEFLGCSRHTPSLDSSAGGGGCGG